MRLHSSTLLLSVAIRQEQAHGACCSPYHTIQGWKALGNSQPERVQQGCRQMEGAFLTVLPRGSCCCFVDVVVVKMGIVRTSPCASEDRLRALFTDKVYKAVNSLIKNKKPNKMHSTCETRNKCWSVND